MTEAMPALIQRDSDFFIYKGAWVDGACGATGLANAASTALGRRITPLSVYELMLAHGLCAANGASTIGGLWTTAQLLGCKIAAYRPYAEPWPDWEAWVSAQTEAGNPVVLETAYGQALKDSVTGEGENYINSLLYHFFGGVAWLTGGTSAYASRVFNKIISGPGLWAVDGDNWAWDNGIEWQFNCGDLPQFYDVAVLGAARLCAGFSLVPEKAAPTVWTVQSDGTGKDTAGHVCGKGDIALIESKGLASTEGLMSETYINSRYSFLALSNGDLITWDLTTNAGSFNAAAPVMVALWQEYEALKAVPPVQPPTAIPAEYVAALAAVKALTPAMPALTAAQSALSSAAAIATQVDTALPSGGSLSVPGDSSSFVITNVE